MGETGSTQGKRPTSSAHVLRERMGGASKEATERNREHTRIRQKIFGALKTGEMTVPELQEATGLQAHEVLWHLMAWKKYGKIVERALAGDYYRYGLAEDTKP